MTLCHPLLKTLEMIEKSSVLGLKLLNHVYNLHAVIRKKSRKKSSRNNKYQWLSKSSRLDKRGIRNDSCWSDFWEANWAENTSTSPHNYNYYIIIKKKKEKRIFLLGSSITVQYIILKLWILLKLKNNTTDNKNKKNKLKLKQEDIIIRAKYLQ